MIKLFCFQHIILILFVCINTLYAQQPPAKVVVSRIIEKELSKTCAIVGVVDFDKISGVSSEINGLITHQYVVEGAVVKKGNIMTRLNTDFISKNIEIAKNQQEQVEIKISNTQKNLARYETLFQNDATTEKTYEDLSYLFKELLKKKAEIQLNIEKLNLELAKSAIRAPFRGLVLKKLKNNGEWVSPGMAICEFASVKDIFVNVSVPEELINYITPNEKIFLTINALNKDITGVVKNFVPVADMKSKTIQVKIGINWFPEAIQNMSATVNVPMSNKMKLKMIKRDALIRFNGKEHIYIVEEGKAVLMPVHVVSYENEYIGIDDSTISIHMPVITEGNDRLKPDQVVEIIETIN